MDRQLQPESLKSEASSRTTHAGTAEKAGTDRDVGVLMFPVKQISIIHCWSIIKCWMKTLSKRCSRWRLDDLPDNTLAVISADLEKYYHLSDDKWESLSINIKIELVHRVDCAFIIGGTFQKRRSSGHVVFKQNGSLFRKWKKERQIVINTPLKYKTNKNRNKHDIHFAYQRTIQ